MIERLKYLRSGENSAAIVNKLNQVIDEVNNLKAVIDTLDTVLKRTRTELKDLHPQDSAEEKGTPPERNLCLERALGCGPCQLYNGHDGIHLCNHYAEKGHELPDLDDISPTAIADFKKRVVEKLDDVRNLVESETSIRAMSKAIEIVEETD